MTRSPTDEYAVSVRMSSANGILPFSMCDCRPTAEEIFSLCDAKNSSVSAETCTGVGGCEK